MNKNTIQALTLAVLTGLIVGFGATQISGDALIGLAVTGSYLAVVAMIAIAASDYRSNTKAYFAAPVVTRHFKSSVSATVASGAKARLAA